MCASKGRKSRKGVLELQFVTGRESSNRSCHKRFVQQNTQVTTTTNNTNTRSTQSNGENQQLPSGGASKYEARTSRIVKSNRPYSRTGVLKALNDLQIEKAANMNFSVVAASHNDVLFAKSHADYSLVHLHGSPISNNTESGLAEKESKMSPSVDIAY